MPEFDAMEAFFNGISNSHGQSMTVSSDTLKMIGERAASRFLDEGIPLNNSIVKMASEHGALNHEHIKRIVEHANSTVYLAKHELAKTAGALTSAPHFNLADPSLIIHKLGEEAEPIKTATSDSSYRRPPEKQKTSSVVDDDILRLGFSVSETQPDYTKATLEKRAFDSKSDLKQLKDSLQHSADEFKASFQDAQEDFYENTKRHILGGHSFADVIIAANSVGTNEEKIASLMVPIIDRLLLEKVSSAENLYSQTDLTKVAHRVVNEQHPLVQRFGEMVVCEEELQKIALSLEDVEGRLVEVSQHIKEHFSGYRKTSKIS